MELDGDEKKTLFLGNIPEHYGEADVAAAFGEHGCPTPWKVLLRPGYRGAQFGFAYFNRQSDCLQILEQNSMADSFITWDTGSWALIKKAKPKPKAASRPTTVAPPPPKMPAVVVPPPMLLPIPPPPPVPAPQVPRVLTPHRPQDPRVRKTPPWAKEGIASSSTAPPSTTRVASSTTTITTTLDIDVQPKKRPRHNVPVKKVVVVKALFSYTERQLKFFFVFDNSMCLGVRMIYRCSKRMRLCLKMIQTCVGVTYVCCGAVCPCSEMTCAHVRKSMLLFGNPRFCLDVTCL